MRSNSNTTGDANTAIGAYALEHLDGGDSYNIALGYFAGGNVVNGINDIFIGNIGPLGEDTDQNTIRIGNQVTAYDFHGGVHNRHVATYIAGISEAGVSGAPVLVSADGQLGIALSAVRFKEAIQPIDTASEAIFALNPSAFVTKNSSIRSGSRSLAWLLRRWKSKSRSGKYAIAMGNCKPFATTR